ncbi:MAG: arginine N-succinyltransferase [Phycisphaeraceae bacterium]
MLVIRPVSLNDLDQLVELTSMTSFGLTSLPKDRHLLRTRIAASQRAIEDTPDKPGGESYLFVMEDTDTGAVVGTSGVTAKVGGFEPFYAYRIETSVHESKMLNTRKEIRSLHLVTEHSGPTELVSLFLRPSHRRSGNGRFLSLARFLFLAEHPARFEPIVIAELRGVIDERGRSAFWDALGRHFFDIEFPDADYLSVVNKRFIADLMPTHPIYIPLLPRAAQEVIGQVHDRTRPALDLLLSEGFEHGQMVDIFEAGPIVRCRREQIHTVKHSVRATVADIADKPIESDTFIISNTLADFRACLGQVAADSPGRVRLANDTAAALGIKPGDTVRYAPLRSKPQAESR